MSPTMEFELAVVAIGIIVTVLAVTLHGSNVAVAGMFIVALASYAAWLDRPH